MSLRVCVCSCGFFNFLLKLRDLSLKKNSTFHLPILVTCTSHVMSSIVYYISLSP